MKSVGNQAIEPYRIYSQMTPGKLPNGDTSYIADRPAAPDLKWERNIQINAGLDFSFLNGRITTSIDYYNKLSKENRLDENVIYSIMTEEKANQKEKISLKMEDIDKFFPKDYTPRQKTDVIMRLLANWAKSKKKERSR